MNKLNSSCNPLNIPIRFEVISNYPDSPYSIGQIVLIPMYNFKEGYFRRYPHIFKELYWWQKRKKNELPTKLGYSRWISSDGDFSEFKGEFEDILEVKQHNLKEFNGDKFLSKTGEEVSYLVWWPII